MTVDTMNAAQMQSLGRKPDEGCLETWPDDPGYNRGGLKQCWNCRFTCDFSSDLEAHWQRRHGLKPLPLGGQHYIPDGCGNNRVEFGFTGFSSQVPTVDRVVGRTRQDVEERIAGLLKSRATMTNYLWLKMVQEDWHGCQDAGSDLRDIDAEIVGLRWVLGS